MKGGLFVTTETAFFALACTILSDGWPGAHVTNEALQIHDNGGRLFTLFDDTGSEWEWADVLQRLELAAGRAVQGFAFECRWEDLLASIGVRLQGQIEKPVWVIDGNGVQWPANGIDVGKILL